MTDREIDRNGATEEVMIKDLNMSLQNEDVQQELKKIGWTATEENLLKLVRETLDELVKEGSLYRDPHGRYYGSEHPVAKAYKASGY